MTKNLTINENLENISINNSIVNIVDYVDEIFLKAIEMDVSDIHIEPTEKFILIRFRKYGDFFIYDKVDKDFISSLITRLKVLSKIKIDENKKPQDGKITYFYEEEDKNIDIRLSTLPTKFGEKVVMRILKQDESLINLDNLNFLDLNLEKIKKQLKSNYGIVLVAGPTGSGKTTTLFGILKYFNPLEYNISTLEDPVEYDIEYVNQSQVKPEIGYTFGTGLRSLLRQDPDIIMVGEIRDKETASLSVESALTGHLVLSTIHTNSAAATIQRLINMGIEPFLLSSAIKMVISQRLGKRICKHCIKEVKISETQVSRIKEYLIPISEEKTLDSIKFYEGAGCEKCNFTGYNGRIGFHEVLIVGDYLEEYILNKESVTKIQEIGIKNGMITIVQDALLKAVMGETTVEEAFKLI